MRCILRGRSGNLSSSIAKNFIARSLLPWDLPSHTMAVSAFWYTLYIFATGTAFFFFFFFGKISLIDADSIDTKGASTSHTPAGPRACQAEN